jgi:uncharacterized protein (TIGR02284 family)
MPVLQEINMDTKSTRAVLDELLHTLQDGDDGYTKAAERIAESNRPELSAHFIACAKQRREFHKELSELSEGIGGEPSEDGTVAAKLHRGWMAVKDAVSGDDPDGVIKAAESGELYALARYQEASEADLPPMVRVVVERQYGEVRTAEAKLAALVRGA